MTKFNPAKLMLLAILLCTLMFSPTLICLNGSETPQPATWNKTFPSKQGSGNCVIQAADGGYVVAGTNNSESLLLKTNATGELLWSRTYGAGTANCVLQTNDGGYLLAGNSASATLVKTDAQGNLVWSNVYLKQHGVLCTNALISTSDGCFAFVGSLSNETGFFIKTDSEGNELWSQIYSMRTYDIRSLENLQDVIQTDDGGYALAASRCMAKTDFAGNVQWTRDVGGDPAFLIATPDGGYVLPGTQSLSYDNLLVMSSLLVKTNAEGDWQWREDLFTGQRNELLAATRTVDGSYFAAGSVREPPEDSTDYGVPFLLLDNCVAGVVKVDADGNLIGNLTYPPKAGGSNYIFSVIQAEDGNCVFTGSLGTGEAESDIWLVRTEIQHFPDLTPPVITIFSPKNFTYSGSAYLTFKVNEPTAWITCSLDGKPAVSLAENLTLTGLTNGSHTVVVYAGDLAGNNGASETVFFSSQSNVEAPISTLNSPVLDLPQDEFLEITIVSPQNQSTSKTATVPLTFLLNKTASWMGYSLDGQTTVTVLGNATVPALPNGTHSLTLYANASNRNVTASETVEFAVAAPEAQFPGSSLSSQPDYTASILAAALIAAVLTITAGYLLLRRKPAPKNETTNR